MAKVLVVDDEESFRYSFRRFLTDAGFDVAVASHSTEAKTVLSLNEFEVAVVDRILSEGQNGLDLILYIKSVQPFCQAIMITGYPSFESAAETLRCETFAYLTKPVKREKICRVVDEAARQSKSKREKDIKIKATERQLLQASRMEAIGRLASGIAHDFKNLLQLITGNIDLLLRNKQPEHPDYKVLNRLKTAGQRGSELIIASCPFGGRSQTLHAPYMTAWIVLFDRITRMWLLIRISKLT